jgi:hypothetical protein
VKVKEILPILKDSGWQCHKDEAGDYFCLIDIDERQAQIIPTIGKRIDHFRVSFMPSVSTKGFTAATAFILGEQCDHEPIIVSNDIPEKIANFSAVDVVRLSQAAITWAISQDVEKGLAAYRALPTDSKGALPLRHLSALAIAGNIKKLEEYKCSFEQGDRLGFVPYISLEMLERAILVSLNY